MKKSSLLAASMLAAGASVSGAWGEKVKASHLESINLAKNHATKIDHLGRKKPKGSAAAQRREAKKRKALRARSKK